MIESSRQGWFLGAHPIEILYSLAESPEIWGILLTLLLLFVIWYIFYAPAYWIKVKQILNHLPFCLFCKYLIKFYRFQDLAYVKASSDNERNSKIDRMRRLRKLGAKLPPPYPNGWFAIAESDDLKVGQAIAVDCLGENLVVFRTAMGKVNILNAYCRHSGENLGVCGKVEGNCIVCPFDNWKYSGIDGSLVEIPNSKDISEGRKLDLIQIL